MVQTWQITPTHNIKLDLDVSALDEVTRRLPDGYYSTFRTFDECRRVLGLTAHLRRLYEPVSAPEVEEAILRRELRALLEPYRSGEARVRAVMTEQGQVYLAMAPLTPLPRELYEKGVRVETTALQRQQPRLKSTSFIGRSDAERKHIAQEGIFEALLVKDGKILEGMTSNFFYVVGRDARHWQQMWFAEQPTQVNNPPYLGTARDNILLGITRATVIDIARERGMEVKYRALDLAQLTKIDEAFITSSSRGIIPVIQIDEVAIGQGNPGPVTTQLISAYEESILKKAEKI